MKKEKENSMAEARRSKHYKQCLKEARERIKSEVKSYNASKEKIKKVFDKQQGIGIDFDLCIDDLTELLEEEKVQQKKNMVEIIKEEMSDLMKNPSEKDDIAIAYLAKVLKKILTSPNKEQ